MQFVRNWMIQTQVKFDTKFLADARLMRPCLLKKGSMFSAALIILLFTSLLTACSEQPGSSDTHDGRFKVVTTFTVIADMAQNVAGDAAEVVSITKPGAEIHNYQPTPRDIIKAQDADLILWNGLNLELWFEKFFWQI